MYFYLSFLLALALGVHCAPWSTVERESTTPEGVLSLPVRSKDLSEQEIRKKNPASSRAAAPVSSDIIAVSPFSLGHSYEVAIEIGTPRQPLWLPVTLSSNNLWTTPLYAFFEEHFSGRNQTGERCTGVEPGFYNPHHSSTARNLSNAFVKGEGEAFLRLWAFEDDVWVASRRIHRAQFGLNQDPGDYSSVGSLGLGLSVPRGRDRLDGVLGGLLSSGLVQSLTFSMSIGAAGTRLADAEGAGALVFGGVDIRKYHGELRRLSLLNLWETAFGLSYCINLHAIQFLGTSETSSWTLTGPADVFRACLDTTSPFTELPDAPFRRLLQFFPEAELVGSDVYSVPCDYADAMAHVRFRFGDAVSIDVPYREFILQPSRVAGDESDYCILGIKNSYSESYARLGETFLRSATLVVDTDDRGIYLAQYANCGSATRLWNSGSTPPVGICTSP